MSEEIVELTPDEPNGSNPVEVQLETTDANKPAPVTEKRTEPVISEDEGIEILREQAKRAREEAQRRMADAQRQIDEAHRRAAQAETEVHTTRADAVAKSIEAITRDRENAKRDYQLAMETSDYAKAAEAQDRLSTSAAELVELKRAHFALQEEAKNPRPPQQPQYVDEVEALARQLSPKSAAWVRQHPEYATGDKNKAMIRAHYAAIGEDIPPESDEYFRFINQRLGIQRREVEQEQPARRTESRAPLSAPVGRDMAPNGKRSGPSTIRLTPAEVEVALELNMDPSKSREQILKEYARNKVALESEGKISRAS